MAATFAIPPLVVPAVVVNFIFTGLAFLIVGLRLCTRAFMVKNMGADDIFIAFSMVSSLLMSLVMIVAKIWGNNMGRIDRGNPCPGHSDPC